MTRIIPRNSEPRNKGLVWLSPRFALACLISALAWSTDGQALLSTFAGDAGVRPDAEALRNRPQWRGPLANGVAPLATFSHAKFRMDSTTRPNQLSDYAG